MAGGKGSASQASTMVPRAGGATAAPGAGAVGLRQRRPAPARGSGAVSRLQQNVMNMYADESPGLKITPVAVLVMSLGYIAFVTVLHIVGKIRGV